MSANAQPNGPPLHISIPIRPKLPRAPSDQASPAPSGDSEGSRGGGTSIGPDLSSTTARIYPVRSVMYPSARPPNLRHHSGSVASTSYTSGLPGAIKSDGDSIPSDTGSPTPGKRQWSSLDPYLAEPTTHEKRSEVDGEERSIGGVKDQGRTEAVNGHSVLGSRMGAEIRGDAFREDDDVPSPLLMTTRFEHAVQEDGSSWVLTGWEGKPQRCEDEPIHVPGAIQAFGVLVVLDEDTSGNLVVQQVSENSRFVIGISPSSLFRAKSLTNFLSEEEIEVLSEALEAWTDRDLDPTNTEIGPINFTLSGEGSPGTGSASATSSARQQWTCHCAIHRPDTVNRPERVVLEMELVDDHLNPMRTVAPGKEHEPEVEDEGSASRGINDEQSFIPSEEAIKKSTVNMVQPLRALARYKKRLERTRPGKRAAEEMDVVGLLSQINEQLAKADQLEEFLQITAGVFKELTEFDRVMVYQFDEKWNGQIVAECVDWTKTKELFLGLNFPATDIPAQARELYRINKVRLLYDRDQPTARMCCRSLEEVEKPVDMTHCHLRAMSPIHIKYLGNMGVRSSMSVSITAFGDLWGLVSLHTYGKYGQRVSFPLRQLCKLLGESISRNIERLSYAKRLHSRKLINTAPTSINPSGYIVAKAEDLLALFDADFGVLSIGEEAKVGAKRSLGGADLGIGVKLARAFCHSRVLAVWTLHARISASLSRSILTFFFPTIRQMQSSQNIRNDFPDIDYPAGFELIAGLLSVPLSGEGKDFIVFFRKSQVEVRKITSTPPGFRALTLVGCSQEVHWAGNPYAGKNKDAGVVKSLEPRTSFKAWSELVVGRCRKWTDEQLETAGVLCLVYGKFIDVWRQKETALAASQLTTLLLANASHEVRTPLNAIINYLELALDGPVDGETREHLTKSHTASRTLIHVINDLLDLTRTETGNDLFLQDPFDLPSTITEATQIHKAEAKRRGLTLEVVESPSGTPPIVMGDRGKIRQIITNIVGNAVKHTTAGGVMIEWGELVDSNVEDALESRKDSIRIGISITDTGVGISDQRLESLFREFEQVITVESDVQSTLTPTVGLGLAVVARIVRNLGGQLMVESKENEGSKFTCSIPFRLPTLDNDTAMSVSGAGGSQQYSSVVSSGNPKELGSAVSSASLVRSRSQGSARSARSVGSASRSDIDSLINAMSTSHMDSLYPRAESIPSSRTAQVRRPIEARSVNVPGEMELGDTAVPLRPVRVTAPVEPRLLRRRGATTQPTPSPLAVPEPTHIYPSSLPITPPASSPACSPAGFPSSMLQEEIFPLPPPTTISIPPPPPSLPRAKDPTPSPPDEILTAIGLSRHATITPGVKPSKSTLALTNPHPHMRVLVVEDELINRMIIEKRLKMEGHDVVTAEHGGDALRLLGKDTSFDIVLMDLSMPIVNGFDCSLGIRDMEKKLLFPGPDNVPRPTSLLNGRLPILAVSASLHERQKVQLTDAAIDGWLLKPVDFKRLATLMRGAVDVNQRNLDVYAPGNWEKGGWLSKAPTRRATLSDRRFASLP
ncbi:hypothetical protein P7C70_g1590, partial [Phenoliferia sp. Uapishka_3]